MSGRIADRLAELGLELPEPASSAGAYVPFVTVHGAVFISGQLPMADGQLKYKGQIGADLTVDDGYAAARLCALNLTAQLREACSGNLDHVFRVARLGGFVNCTANFVDHPKVINGASDLMVEIFGEVGRHARFAVGAPSLPFGAAVEIEGIFHIK